MSQRNDELLFTDEPLHEDFTSPINPLGSIGAWKVLIVDDDPEVHTVTHFALKRFVFEGKPLHFISAYSAAEGRLRLQEHPDMAVVLLDVVMEDEHAGLRLAHYIRTELNNTLVRIILRTGQPGQAPEQTVITDYDINDYKEKTELTAQKLHTTMTTALRSFRDLRIIDLDRRGLKKVIEASTSIFEQQSLHKLLSGALSQLSLLFHLSPRVVSDAAAPLNSFVILRYPGEAFTLIDGNGPYAGAVGQTIPGALPPAVMADIRQAVEQRQTLYLPGRVLLYFRSKQQVESIFYLEDLHALSDWEQHLVELFAINLSIAQDNLLLNEEIVDTQREIIFTLGEIAEARSAETGQHVKRVAELCKLLGLKYGISEADAEILKMAASIHDIGKLGIPDSILLKPGKLTPEEFAVMKQHATAGYDMLKNSSRPILQAAATIAREHHEHFNGRGYPRGLKGEEIHLYSRIVALADVFDALGNERVYKAAWPLDKIVDLISSQRGEQFDPVLVDLLLAHLDEFAKIREELPDYHA